MSCLAALLLVLLPPPPAGAGNESWNALDLKPGVKVVVVAWENVSQLPAGQRIRIIRTNLSQVDGTLEEATGSGLTLARHGARLLVARNRIRKVRVLIKSNTAQAATVGATIGFPAEFAAIEPSGMNSPSRSILAKCQPPGGTYK